MSSNEPRDQLAGLLRESWEEGGSPAETAGYLLDRGWRPPPRVIETAEELDALSTGTAILASGEVYLGRRLEVDGAAPILWYWAFGVLGRTSVMVLAACGDGVTVLHEPKEEARG